MGLKAVRLTRESKPVTVWPQEFRLLRKAEFQPLGGFAESLRAQCKKARHLRDNRNSVPLIYWPLYNMENDTRVSA